MAGANSLLGLGYDLVGSSWVVASVLMKYFLIGVILRSIQLGDFSVEKIEERLLEYGKYVVLGTGLLGIVSHIIGISPKPVFLLPSQLIAVLVLGFLFWKY